MATFTGKDPIPPSTGNDLARVNVAPIVGFTGATQTDLDDSVGDLFDALGGNDTVAAGDGNATINGGDGDDSLDGGLGADVINGGNGIDYVAGAAGNDTLDGGAGADALVGGIGNDTYYISTYLDFVVEDAGAGIDIVFASDSYTLNANVEKATLTGPTPMPIGANCLGAIGNDLANEIIGDNYRNGITGGEGNDTLSGQDGDDTLNGQAGDDSIDGGFGNDVMFVDSALDIVFETANPGIDTIWSAVTWELGAYVEILILDGTANINGSNSPFPFSFVNNLILGNVGNNNLTARLGDDVVLGGDGNDVISTGGGSANGPEIISGGNGVDTLTSGGGHDFFTYQSISEGGDTITDFGQVGGNDLDILDLRPMFFPTFTNTAGITTVAHAVTSGHLTFTQFGNATQVFAEADGGGNNNLMLAQLNNTTAATVQILTLI